MINFLSLKKIIQPFCILEKVDKLNCLFLTVEQSKGKQQRHFLPSEKAKLLRFRKFPRQWAQTILRHPLRELPWTTNRRISESIFLSQAPLLARPDVYMAPPPAKFNSEICFRSGRQEKKAAGILLLRSALWSAKLTRRRLQSGCNELGGRLLFWKEGTRREVGACVRLRQSLFLSASIWIINCVLTHSFSAFLAISFYLTLLCLTLWQFLLRAFSPRHFSVAAASVVLYWFRIINLEWAALSFSPPALMQGILFMCGALPSCSLARTL